MSAVVAPPEADAELVVRQLTSGKSRPIVVSARLPGGSTVECVVKLRSRLSTAPTEYLLEWVAASLARLLGIETPESFEVTLGKDFVDAIDDPVLRAAAESSVGSAYGSKFLPTHSQWIERKLHPDMRAAAGDLLAFDVYVHNADRRRGNANLLVNRDRFVAIDHGEAFSFLYALGGADPADDPLLKVVEQHVFAQVLKGQLGDLAAFRQALRGVTDGRLAEIEAATPPAWQDGLATRKLDGILQVVKKRRDRVDHWLSQVMAWMSK